MALIVLLIVNLVAVFCSSHEPNAYWFALVGPQESGRDPHKFYYQPHVTRQAFKTRLNGAVLQAKREGWMGSTDFILFMNGNRFGIAVEFIPLCS